MLWSWKVWGYQCQEMLLPVVPGNEFKNTSEILYNNCPSLERDTTSWGVPRKANIKGFFQGLRGLSLPSLAQWRGGHFFTMERNANRKLLLLEEQTRNMWIGLSALALMEFRKCLGDSEQCFTAWKMLASGKINAALILFPPGCSCLFGISQVWCAESLADYPQGEDNSQLLFRKLLLE